MIFKKMIIHKIFVKNPNLDIVVFIDNIFQEVFLKMYIYM